MNFLEVRRLCSGYGKKQVLFDLSFSARTGEISAIIGPNGSGKSTALKAIFGVPPVWQGEIRVKGRLVSGWRPLEGITNGMALVPQGNRVFNDLSLLENLEIGGLHLAHRKRRESIRMVMRLFPWLGRRSREAAGRLSGGEQQMVAISRALVSQPEALLLDEPSLGLSPGKVKTVFAQISRLNAELGTTILIVEQRVRAVLQLAQAVHALKLGRCVYSGNASALLQDSDRLKSIFL
jgi:branched-chain amino acid transport system ATP-binding protein